MLKEFCFYSCPRLFPFTDALWECRQVSLMPGKLQKQTSETVKHTRNPVYNREFFFNDINMEELRNLRLRIKAFHKSQNLKLAEYLGEVNIPLANYDLLMENRMWNDLHFKPCKWVRGCGAFEMTSTLSPMKGSWVRVHMG